MTVKLIDARTSLKRYGFGQMDTIVKNADFTFYEAKEESIEVYLVDDDCKYLEEEKKCNDGMPSTEVIGVYIQTSDYNNNEPHILISPTRIIRCTVDKTYETIFKKVLYHELAHFYMDIPKRDINKFDEEHSRLIEEGIANFVALSQFSDPEKGVVLDFIRNQPAGYKDAARYDTKKFDAKTLANQWKQCKAQFKPNICIEVKCMNETSDPICYSEALVENAYKSNDDLNFLNVILSAQDITYTVECGEDGTVTLPEGLTLPEDVQKKIVKKRQEFRDKIAEIKAAEQKQKDEEAQIKAQKEWDNLTPQEKQKRKDEEAQKLEEIGRAIEDGSWEFL